MSRIELVRPGAGEIDRGLRCLVAGPELSPEAPRDAGVEQQVQQFRQYARQAGINLNRQVLGMAEGCVAGMCLWVVSPGKAAMLFCPNVTEYPQSASFTEACVRAALRDAQADGISLVQVMLEPTDLAGAAMFAGAGLEPLATLIYMDRRPPRTVVREELPPGFRLEPYSAGTHEALCQAIVGSYEQTLDCPRLSGLRSIEDVVAGHKAVGVFDPQLWGVLLEGTEPAGCLLLAEMPARQSLELVYLGLTPRARGRGLGRALMQRMLALGVRRRAEVLCLAVDESNVPALRLYRRFGFSAVARRQAMIRAL